MSKWLRDFKTSRLKRIEKRIEKLSVEQYDLELNYRDFPYDRTYKAIERRRTEIEELEEYKNIEFSTNDSQIELAQCYVLAYNIKTATYEEERMRHKILQICEGAEIR